jgi:hypothetical protein
MVIPFINTYAIDIYFTLLSFTIENWLKSTTTTFELIVFYVKSYALKRNIMQYESHNEQQRDYFSHLQTMV